MTKIKYQTKEVAITVVTQDGNELKYCTPELQNDEDVVILALKKGGRNFKYASNELKSNKTFIMEALHKGVEPWVLIGNSTIIIQSDTEVMSLAIEKSDGGWEFACAQGKAALNKELAAKALVKWGAYAGSDLGLWKNLHLTIQKFFPKDSWYEKAQSYLIQLEQEKQAKLVSGGSKEEDEVVW